MKSFNSHLYRSAALAKSGLPKHSKVVVFGSPNVDSKMFAHRIAIDLGVPAISIKQIYKTILAFEDQYSQETFYRKVISILKNPNQTEAAVQLEGELIPEKLLTLTKYSELGYVLYDYPNNRHQAKNLEQHSNGGVNLALNLMLKKEVAKLREESRHQCENCGREYFKDNLLLKEEGTDFKANFPEDGVCGDVSD